MRFILIDELRQQNCINHLLGLNLDGKTQVVFKKYKADRSLIQNNLMWLWYGVICEHIGHEPDDLHEIMKGKVFGLKRLKGKDSDGNVFTLNVPNNSTSKLNVEEMTEFLLAVEMLAGELGVLLPYPDDYKLAITGKKN